jgi:hypothetical protein
MRVFTLSSGKAVTVDSTLDMDAATSVLYRLIHRSRGGWRCCSWCRWSGRDDDEAGRRLSSPFLLLLLLPVAGMIGSDGLAESSCMFVGSSAVISRRHE